MKRAKLLIIALLCFAGFQQAAAQSDIELTDSISNEWDGDTGGGGIIPSMPSNPVTSLTMSQTSITIMGGERYKLTAKTNSDAGNKRVIWSIADKSIAFLGSDGVIRGLKTGKTTVTASSVSNPEITASCSVTVTSDYVAPESGWILPWGKDEAWDMSYLYFEQSKYREPALDKNGNNWKELNYDDTKWKTITGPMGSPEVDYAPFNYVWKGENNCFCLRRKFTLPSIDDGKYTFSTLHDDGVVFYLNGKEIINEENWSEKNIRNYTISADNFVEGENILSIYIKQGTGNAYLDYALYYEHDGKPSDRFDIGFLPDVSFEFFYDATLYNETTQSIPNHEAAKLAGYNLKLSANIPTFKENYLSIGSRCEGYIDKWEKNSTESGEYFFRTSTDCMTIVCRVKPKINTNNASDLISNRGGGHNYMFRVGDHNSFFLHTGTAYEESRAINLSEYDGSQVLAVRVDGVNNYIQLDNFTTGESKKISGVNWGSDNNIMKFFYNDNKEYYTGDVYWMYYSKKYVADKDLRGLISYGLRKNYNITYIVDGEIYKVERLEEGTPITPITPHKEGYTFNGWSGLPQIMPARDITVTGNFTANTYNLIYMLDGKEYKKLSVKFGEKITPETAPNKEGYTFSGWNGLPETMPAKDITVTGSFAANYYDLIYMVDGKEYKRVSVKYGENITPEMALTKEGHTFSGWSEIPETMPAKDVTVTGTFTVNTYNLIYMLDGKEYKRVSVRYGEIIVPVEGPTKDGHTFSGWKGLPETMPARDVTVTGSFVANYYDLIYMVDGKEYKRVSIKFGETITPETAPTKEGHTFSGWSEIPETMPAKDVTVTGKFTVNTYKLTYVVDGKVYKTVSMKYGETITPETAPNKEGHTFSGWNGLPETMPAKDITVTGSFAANYYDLIYMVDGKEYKRVSIKFGETITPETAPDKEGYTFSGWSGLPQTMPAKDVTVTGKFTVNTYKLTYVVDGKVYKTVSMKYGETITPETAPNKEGHTFSGWNGLPTIMPARDVTVTGKLAANYYDLIYMVDGKEYKRVSIKFGETITPETAPTKEGHTFSGWIGIAETMPAKDVTVTGKFTVNTYKITYMVDGEVYKTVDVKYGENITAVEEPTKEGYSFSGWKGLPETMPAKNVTATGKFVANYYDLIYMVDGKEHKRVSIKFGETIAPETAPDKEGHTFSGWNGLPATMPAKDITVTGTFTVNTYKITYMVDSAVYKTVSVKYGETIVPIEDPTKEGHTFNGWKGKDLDKVKKPIDIAGNADKMLYSNAYCTMPGDEFIGWHVLFDNDPNTFFHSEWNSTKNSTDGLDHYLRVDLGVGNEIEQFSFTYTNRGNLSDGAPKTIVIEGSNIADGAYTEITTLTDLPGGKADVYKSDVIGNGNKYRFIRFRVTETKMNQKNNEHPFFYMSEFGMAEYADFIPETMPARDITVTGSFTVNTYNLVYMVDDKVYETKTYAFGEKIIPIEEPTKEGFIFSGWNGIPTTMPAKDIIVTGTFGTALSYNITYIVDGEVYATGKAVYGEKIQLIEEPTKEGHTFSGWSEVPETMPARDITVTGTFTINTYKITYMVDGEVYKTVDVKYGENITAIEGPTKEGHTFSGWSEVPETMPAKDITVTGSYTVNTYKITYKVDGVVYQTISLKYGETIVPIENLTKDGHTFSGWKREDDVNRPIDIAGNADNMLYSNAYCTMPLDEFIGWHVLFDNDPNTFFHSEWNSMNNSTDGLEHYLRVDLGVGNEIEKFSFTYTNRGNLSDAAPKTIVIEGSNMADGAYTEITTLTDLPGGKADVYKSDVIGNGNKYRFIRFRVTETQRNLIYNEHPFFYISEFGMTEHADFIPETMPAKDITVTGSFTVNTYNLIYMLDGKEYKRIPVKYGETITPETAPTKEGHTFSGWSGLPQTMPARDVTVTGEFTVNTYKLTYVVDDEVYKTVSMKYGETITPETEPTKEGHTFSGWSEVPETMPAEDITVTGKFTVNTYKITYMVDSAVYKTVSVKYGETITPEPEPTKEGHSFSGWSGLPQTMPARDVTVTGEFTVNTYKLTYVVDDEVYKTVSIKYGETITPEPEPTKEGHTFSGWSGLPETMPANDVRVTGSFTVNTYKLTYMVDGEVYTTVDVKYGETITAVEEPTKEGYTFSGWSGLPKIMPANDVRVTGSFTVNTYKLTYMVDGEVYATVDVKYSENITAIEEPTKEGHTFSGWSEVPETMPARDITVTGTFTVNTYKITYMVDGEVYKTVDVKYGENITAIEEPTKEGHSFSGWSEVPETMPARDITVTGTFTVNYYNVIYIVDGEVYETVSTAYGDEIVLIDEPTKDGYKFSGWSEAPDRMPAEDVVITGSFEYTNIVSPTTKSVVDVYSLQGVLLHKGVEDLNSIPKGLYIINGKKVFIK